MQESEIIILEGSNFFRQYLVYSILSGRRISIRNIRPYDDSPGIKDFEYKLLSLIDLITNGSEIDINKTGNQYIGHQGSQVSQEACLALPVGFHFVKCYNCYANCTQVDFSPGTLQGGSFEFQCGVERCISYFLEPLIFLAPFCKIAINGNLKGLTNVPDELSVDAINSTWLPVFSRFVPTDDDLYLKINARGFLPDAGGSVTFCSPIKKNLRPVQFVKPGKICKIRGLAYVCKVSPSIASRMIEGAKKMLHGYISDVYITIDQRKGPQGGLSPGFGIFITASTTEGVSYSAEAMSNPKDSQKIQLIPEEIGAEAAKRLLNEIYKGGCTDSSAQALATTFMTLCDKDVSKFLFGPLSFYCVHTMRNLRLFFNHTFKLDELWKLEKKEFDEEKKSRCTGSEDKCLLTCKEGNLQDSEDCLEEENLLHSLPCQIEFTGPAPVSVYFNKENLHHENVRAASFRGHMLLNKLVKVSEGYEIYTVSESNAETK
uniref:RNA 3'-terminal phosphate cyclase-like protein n=1 Tax=Meloidogyne javanica TaxID=6303 RepID=A0A915LKG3_MELJA